MRGALVALLVVAGCAAPPRDEAPSPEAIAAGEAAGKATLRPPFPGAVGAGAFPLGGRGGAVLHVTTLADDGPGSLRAAVEARGPRVVVFDVAGTIELRRRLRVRESYLTIAGESAPGGGVCLKGAEVDVQAHHVVLRHLRVRLGRPASRDLGEDALRIDRSTYVVVDHCSFSWGVDETCSVVDSDHVTFSSCVVAEGLRRAGHEDGDHSMGMLVRGGHDLWLVRCLFMRNENRNPQVEEGSTVFLEGNLVSRYRRGLRLNDLDDPPPDPLDSSRQLASVRARGTRFVAPRARGEEIVVDDSVTHALLSLEGNVGPRGRDWEAATLTNPGGRAALERATLDDPRPAPAAFELDRVGALPRDACDARLVAEVEGGGPDVVDDPAEVGGWPVLASGTPEPDGDRDGVPDAWEAAHETDPAVFDAWADPDGDGWASLEAWLAERAAR